MKETNGVHIAKDPVSGRIWANSDEFSIIFKNGTWKRGIPSAYELMDNFGDISYYEDPLPWVRAAIAAVAADPSLTLAAWKAELL